MSDNNTLSGALRAGKDLRRAYVRLLESGRDRIMDLGGTCDPVEVMEASDPYLRQFDLAIAALAAQPEVGGEWVLVPQVPTEMMLTEAWKASTTPTSEGNTRRIYAAMIAAASTPVAVGQGEADIVQEVLMDQSLRERTLSLLNQTCSAWSDVKDGGEINEAKCQLASVQQKYLRAAINDLADLTHPATVRDAGQGEAVAFVHHHLNGAVQLVWQSTAVMHNPPPSGTKLFTHPAAVREVDDAMVERAKLACCVPMPGGSGFAYFAPETNDDWRSVLTAALARDGVEGGA